VRACAQNFAARGEVLGCLAVAKGGDTAVAYARSGRLLTFPLGAVDALEEAGEHFTPLITGDTHSGAVVALDAAAAKPLLATVGTDRKLRVWNYLRWRCDVVHDFKTEEPSCVALQPTGYALAVGFKVSGVCILHESIYRGHVVYYCALQYYVAVVSGSLS
jgi:hypothetical protein